VAIACPTILDSSFLSFYRGFGEYYQKDFERASKDFNRAYEIDPTLYAQIGKALSESIAHRGADGLQILHSLENKITDRGIGDPEAAYKIAQAYAVLGTRFLLSVRYDVALSLACFLIPDIATDPLLTGFRSKTEFRQTLEASRQRHGVFRHTFF